MLSVTHSSGMPPKVRKASSRHASRSSVVLVLVGMKRCLRECPSVPDHTLNSKTSPFASASLTSLLPVELQLAARRRLEARVRLRGGGAEGDPPPAAPRGERPVTRQRRIVVQVQQHLVHPLLRRPGQDGLRLDDRPHALERALSVGPAVPRLAALPPVLGHGVPVQAVPPRYVAEVRLGPGGPVHAQLAHHVPLHPRSSRRLRILGRSIFPFAQLVGVRLRERRVSVSADGAKRLREWLFLH